MSRYGIKGMGLTERQQKRRRGRPSLQESEDIDARDRILDCALHTFAERGFDATSFRMIATRAGVTHTMITYYYSTKEELWAAAVEFLFQRMERELSPQPIEIEGEVDDATLIAFARDGLRRYVRYVAQHPEHHRLMIQEATRLSQRLQWVTERFTRNQHVAGFAAIKMLQERGVLPHVDTLSLMYMVIGAAQLPYVLSAELKLVWDIDPLADDRVAAHIDAMLAVFIPDPIS